MNNYHIISPSVNGILSDDSMYFEGINRPSKLFLFKDGNDMGTDDINVLEKYFNDVYNLFLRKLSTFTISQNTNDEDDIKMQALLQELIKVKKIIMNIAK